MYESQTFEAIMSRMLTRVPNTLDKREGSIIWDALAPMAAELAQAYIELDAVLNESFAGTATRDYLIRRVAEQGLTPFPASKAVLKGVFKDGTDLPFEVSIGSRYSLDNLTYQVTEKIAPGEYKAECETPGVIGNQKLGALIPIQYAQGLASAALTELLVPGEDEEGTEALRTRYFTEISQRPQDGNVAQYVKWAAGFPGVGKAKIFPLWDGANTVKVSILSAVNTVALPALTDAFQEYLDPDNNGLGNGVAPIGAVVTVATATAISLNITIEVELTAGFTEPIGVEDAIVAHFADLAYSKSAVSYLGLAGKILGVPSVERLQSLTVNSGTSDISLGTEEIPVLGSFTCQVVT